MSGKVHSKDILLATSGCAVVRAKLALLYRFTLTIMETRKGAD